MNIVFPYKDFRKEESTAIANIIAWGFFLHSHVLCIVAVGGEGGLHVFFLLLPPSTAFASTSASSAAAGCKVTVSWHWRALDSMNWMFVFLRIGQKLLFQFYESPVPLKGLRKEETTAIANIIVSGFCIHMFYV